MYQGHGPSASSKFSIASLNISKIHGLSCQWLPGWLAGEFGRLLGKKPKFTGTPAPTGWLNNSGRMVKEFGLPSVPLATMIEWTADWLGRDMATLNKPTHYEVRDGRY